MSADGQRHWRVTLHRTDIFVFRYVEAASAEGAEEQARELLGQHEDLHFLDDREELFDAAPEDE